LHSDLAAMIVYVGDSWPPVTTAVHLSSYRRPEYPHYLKSMAHLVRMST
jgi:hypothetical protein